MDQGLFVNCHDWDTLKFLTEGNMKVARNGSCVQAHSQPSIRRRAPSPKANSFPATLAVTARSIVYILFLPSSILGEIGLGLHSTSQLAWPLGCNSKKPYKMKKRVREADDSNDRDARVQFTSKRPHSGAIISSEGGGDSDSEEFDEDSNEEDEDISVNSDAEVKEAQDSKPKRPISSRKGLFLHQRDAHAPDPSATSIPAKKDNMAPNRQRVLMLSSRGITYRYIRVYCLVLATRTRRLLTFLAVGIAI